MKIIKNINDLMSSNSSKNEDKVRFSIGGYSCSVNAKYIDQRAVLDKAINRVMGRELERIINRLIIDERAVLLKDKQLEISVTIL